MCFDWFFQLTSQLSVNICGCYCRWVEEPEQWTGNRSCFFISSPRLALHAKCHVHLALLIKRLLCRLLPKQNGAKHLIFYNLEFPFPMYSRTSIKRSPLLNGHNHHLQSPNGTFSIVLTCIKWSHGINYSFIQFQIM